MRHVCHLGILGHVIVNWDAKKHKNAIFGLKSYWFVYHSKTTRRVQLKFVDNVGNYKWFMQTEFEGTQSPDQNVTGRNEQKVGNFEPIYLG